MQPDSGKPEAGSSFPGRDAGDGEDAGVNLGVKVEEGGKVGRELGDASQVADSGGDALLTDEGNSGPAGEAKDGREGGTRNRHLSMQREMPAAVKMLMVSVATRWAMRPWTKRPVSTIKAETLPVVEQLPAWSWIRTARAS